jgi:hypothetical protein
MDNREKYKEDLLKHYLNPEQTEKAPEGFTSKLMTRIQLDTLPVEHTVNHRSRNLVPLVSAGVVLVLILTAIIIPDSASDAAGNQVTGFLNNIKAALLSINLRTALRINLPVTLVYVSIGIFLLLVFDRALSGVFKRDK